VKLLNILLINLYTNEIARYINLDGPCPQEPATGPRSKPDDPSPQYFSEIRRNIIVSSTPALSGFQTAADAWLVSYNGPRFFPKFQLTIISPLNIAHAIIFFFCALSIVLVLFKIHTQFRRLHSVFIFRWNLLN
jgi:hypothetical protein